MDIQHAIAPMTPMQAKPEANDKPSESADASSARTGFLQLLQGLTTPEVAEAVDTNAVVATAAAAGAATDAVGVDALRVEASAHTAEVLADGVPVPMPTVSPTMAERSSSEVLGETFDVAHLIGLLDINSLVNQTHRLDAPTQDVDATHLQQAFMGTSPAAGAAALWGAQPQIAAGQAVATVAAGTQQLVPSIRSGEAQPLATAAAVAGEVSGATESVLNAMANAGAPETHQEGRVSLLGAWKLEDPQAQTHPVLQRLMGHIEQWAVAAAGWQPKANERLEPGKNSIDGGAAWLANGQGSGTQLTENAVQETQAAQDTGFDAQADMPTEDMRFWLQGKQQRAEVVLEREGQSVRVQVSVRGNQAQVTFLSDEATTRDMLEGSVAQLRDMLEQQGVMLLGVSVQADARGDTASQQSSERQRWSEGAAKQASVSVPVEGSAVRAPRSAGGVDLYA